MISRVWGEINGVGTMPMLVLGDTYYFSPPQTLTGRYVCQFWAEDEYGNVTNETAIIYLESGIIRSIEIVSKEWQVTLLRDPWKAERYEDTYNVSIEPLTPLTAEADIWEVRELTACEYVKVEYKPMNWNEIQDRTWNGLHGNTWNRIRKKVKS